MKILKITIITILALIAIPLIIALFLPKDFHGEADIVINQPKQEVFEYVKYLKNMDEYATWNMKDPDMKKEYKGEDGTVGFIAYWDSENNEVGKGNQKITNMIDGERVDSEIRFEGFDDPMKASIILESTENANQTRVRWVSSGEMPYPYNLMSLFFDMEDDMNEGLENLKKVMESRGNLG